jgi:hypothetical protein
MLLPSITAEEEIGFVLCLVASNQSARERGNSTPKV